MRGAVAVSLLLSACRTSSPSLADAGQGNHAASPAETERVRAMLQPVLQGCYDAELARSPGLAGSLVVQLQIEEDGSVSRAHVILHRGLTRPVAACIERDVKALHFDRGNKEVLGVPATLAPRPPPAPSASGS